MRAQIKALRRLGPFMAEFSGCEYGPMDLRPLLRARLEAGERLVGWAVVRLGAEPSRDIAMVAASAIPVMGPALGPLLSRASQGVLIVTDRRVLALKGGRIGAAPGGRGIAFEAPIERLQVSRRRDGLITLRDEDSLKPLRIRLINQRRRPPTSDRTAEALTVLAEDKPASDP